MDKEQIALKFMEVMQFNTPIHFRCDGKYKIRVVNSINGLIIVFLCEANCNSSLVDTMTNRFTIANDYSVKDFVDIVCKDKALINFEPDEMENTPEELLNKANAFNCMVIDYCNNGGRPDKGLNDEILAIQNKISSWINDKNCHGIKVYTPGAEFIATITKDFCNDGYVHVQMYVDRNCEYYTVFGNDSINVPNRATTIKISAEDVYEKELVLVPMFYCNDDNAVILNNYSMLILKLIDSCTINVYSNGNKYECIFSIAYSVKTDDESKFVNIRVNEGYKDTEYIEKVVKPELEKYGLDGNLILLFNLSQLILEKGWVF